MILDLDLTLFDANPNTTGDASLSAEMRTYYSDYLIDNAKPNLVHDQFGQKHAIPKNGGKTIQFRKFMPFSKATNPLTEGITPDGGSLSVTNVTATVDQYGYYVTISDMLMLTAIDNTLVETTKLLGAQAGSTLDTITREVLNGGTSVMYSGGKEARDAITEADKLTVDDIFKAARFLKTQNTPKINGSYVAIIHPDVAYDLMRDEEWVDVHKYSNATEIFEGEIGKLGGVRFVESTEAKIFADAGSGGRDVYSTLVLGANAYGVTEVTGGGLEHIVKQLGSGGTADPLNQRATAGWKGTKTAERLVENYMIRIESASSFEGGSN
ncbi:MAG: N4-gp56 family major capsid protein [Clostridia bacterium]|nr:N4-gp56 family major capsid protein [Clostridia bacterium]